MSPNRTLPASRREYIVSTVNAKGSVRVAELAAGLGLSPITIRRDIALLDEEGLLEQVRGGARRISAPGNQALPLQSDITVGLITPSLDFFWPTIIEGANIVADRVGAHLQLQGSTFAAKDNLVEIRRMAEDESIGGLLLVPDLEGPGSDELVEFLETVTKPTVLIERTLKPHGPHSRLFESVITDHASGASLAVRHLAALGHSHIALLTDKRIPSRHLIAQGWADALSDLRLDTESPRGDTTELIGDARTEGIKAFVDNCISEETTAIIAHSDEAALVVVELLAQRGLTVPEDISVIAYGDEIAKLARPALTAVCPPKAELGEVAMQLLLERLSNPGRAIRQTMLAPTLVIRDSTGPAPSRN
ncbi:MULTISPECIES: substrate-binding domain-containing protein [unclassified Actinomyces]|uniref:substrate-binding domain-containing protein n=1 Tax=unclassified Actinomyces TaxID=2609248 RepID=UPI000D5A0E13|nr:MULTISPECIES: substrate-binding domain-containing protein [unclassified Actinomyces]RAX22582.1 DeoR family transcriptional regulator [Actinomyces sp. Z3]